MVIDSTDEATKVEGGPANRAIQPNIATTFVVATLLAEALCLPPWIHAAGWLLFLETRP
jgi:hypothetical protein